MHYDHLLFDTAQRYLGRALLTEADTFRHATGWEAAAVLVQLYVPVYALGPDLSPIGEELTTLAEVLDCFSDNPTAMVGYRPGHALFSTLITDRRHAVRHLTLGGLPRPAVAEWSTRWLDRPAVATLNIGGGMIAIEQADPKAQSFDVEPLGAGEGRVLYRAGRAGAEAAWKPGSSVVEPVPLALPWAIAHSSTFRGRMRLLNTGRSFEDILALRTMIVGVPPD